MTNKRWKYSGDVNLECGGLFYQESGFEDSINAVQVTPMSDMGGPDNQWIISTGNIYLGDDNRRATALESCGAEKPTRDDLILAVHGYYGIDGPDNYLAQIGPKTGDHSNCFEAYQTPAFTLRGNAKLKHFVRSEFLNLSY